MGRISTFYGSHSFNVPCTQAQALCGQSWGKTKSSTNRSDLGTSWDIVWIRFRVTSCYIWTFDAFCAVALCCDSPKLPTLAKSSPFKLSSKTVSPPPCAPSAISLAGSLRYRMKVCVVRLPVRQSRLERSVWGARNPSFS